MSAVLPAIGTICLACCASGLGYLAFVGKADVAQIERANLTAEEDLVTTQTPETPLNLPAPQPDAVYQAITNRPLFSPTRRPQIIPQTPEPTITELPEPEAPQTTIVAEPPDVLPPDDLILSGVLGTDANRSAYLTHVGGDGAWLRVDDEIEGWTVAEIGTDWITLIAGSDSFTLELYE